MRRIAIVGGGPGGLFTAYLLRQKCAEPPRVTVFEATDRLGGKVQTRRFDSAPVPYEAGAAELYQYGDDPLRHLIVKDLGLPCVRMKGGAVVLDGHVVRDADDLARHFGKGAAKALRRFDRLAHRGRDFDTFYECSQTEENFHPWSHMSLATLLDQALPDPAARRYVETLIHSDLATEPAVASALYGVDNYLMNDPDYCKLYSIRGGVERLIAALADACGAAFRTGTRVERVEKSGEESYRVTSVREGVRTADEFDAVVVALPTAWLPSVTWGGERLSAAMAEHRAHYNHPAHYLRVSVLFERPFWRDELPGAFWMLEAFGGCCVYDEGARHDTRGRGVLAWLIAGAEAERLSGRSDSELTDLVLDSLPPQVAEGRALFREAKVHRWVNSVSARPGGRYLKGQEERHVPEPVEHPAFFVVGDYMFDTSINGALDSADFASDGVVDALGLTPADVGVDYFTNYVGQESYDDAFRETFDARYVTGLVRAVWGDRPPYSLLDAGSASGRTLAAFAKLGVDATGVENCKYIHSLTRDKWRSRNHLGDVRGLPFEDESFDYVYETCLAYVPREDLDRAVGELFRVARRGLILGSVVRDMRADVVKRYDLGYGAVNLLSLEEWAEVLRPHGFVPAVTDPRDCATLWKVRPRCFGGDHPFPTAAQLGGCFFTRRAGADGALPFTRVLPPISTNPKRVVG